MKAKEERTEEKEKIVLGRTTYARHDWLLNIEKTSQF